MIWKWRRRPGPSSAMAVLLPADGGDAPSPETLRDLMTAACADLRAGVGTGERDAPLDASVASLATLDRVIDGWAGDTAGRMCAAVGAYLGTVLVNAGAEWRVGEDGRPYVVLPSGRRVDVMAVAGRRIARGRPRLADVAVA